MHRKGLSSKHVFEELAKVYALDNHYDSGRILCSMCTKPHPLAEKAYRMFFESNLGDSGLFPGSAQLEREVVNQLATLLQSKNAAGFIVSGGTEANLMALLAARNIDKKYPSGSGYSRISPFFIYKNLQSHEPKTSLRKVG